MRYFQFILCFLLSCQPALKANSIKDEIKIYKIPCESYKVTKDERALGYVVQPLISEMRDEQKIIAFLGLFEEKIKDKHFKHYDKFLRAYLFETSANNDIILVVVMLSSKQTKNISGWECDEKDVDTYRKGDKSTRKHPSPFYFNCTKGKFQNGVDDFSR